MRGPEQLAALDDFSREFDTNIKAAWDWLVSAAAWAEIRQKMILGLFQFAMIRWRGDELIAWMRKARLNLEPPSSHADWLTLGIVGAVEVYFEENWGIKENLPDERLNTLWQRVEDQDMAEAMGFWFVVLGKIYVRRNRDPRAEERILAAVERIRDQGDRWLLGSTLLIQSFLWGEHPIGRLVEKLDQNLLEALAIFRELGTVYEQGSVLSLMAENAFFKKLPLETVAELFQQTQQFYWQLNDLFGVGTIYQSLSNLYFMGGRPAEGFKALHEMQRVFEQIGDQHMLAVGLHWESIWAARYSTYEHSTETRQRSTDLSQKSRNQTIYFWNLYEFGEIHRIFGNFPKALEYYEEAHHYFERINLLLGLGYYQRALGDLAMQVGRYAEARRHYQVFQSYAEQDNHIWSMVQAYLKLAWANAHLGELEQARTALYNCLNPLRMGHDAGSELMAYLAEVRCLAEEKDFERAVALATFVAENPFSWKETSDLARAMLAELADELEEETFQAATSLLQGRDVRQLSAAWLADYEANHAA
jgi:tetratricopeptide (TPR) repeat protein